MDSLSALVLGLVEGVTEFLPVSSTGHLIVVSAWLGLAQSEVTTAFEVIIQLAAILAVIARYRDRFGRRHLALWLKLMVAFLPFAAVGFLLRHQVKAWFSVEVVATMFIVGGVVFLVLEHFYRDEAAHIDDVEQVGYRQALWIGLAQVAALVPGTSRAGATVVGALLVGLSRRAAAEFSFLLALPVMLAASGYDLARHYREFSEGDLVQLALGFATAFVVAFFTMRLLLGFLERHSFVAFGIYRILFGAALLWWYA